MKMVLTCIICFFNIVTSCNGCYSTRLDDINRQDSLSDNTPLYTLKVSAANPYEIYINDMPLEKNYEKGSSNTEIPFNDFILKSGEQNIKIILLPNKGDSIVDRSGIDHVEIKIYKYTKGILNMNPDEALLVGGFNLKEFNKVPIVEKQVAINLDVPYDIKGWSSSVDLSQEEQETLKAEVLEKYTEIRDIINRGDIKAFSSEYMARDREVNQSFYNNTEAVKEDEAWMSKRISESKGYMKPISNIVLKLYGNNKIVAIENENHESPLISDNGKTEEVYNILLHRPKIGKPLEIIR